jgi:pimeloyl-ACP methyl ester carboxylesterase
MKHVIAKLLALVALACSLEATVHAEPFAKRVDIGRGRMMYIECHGSGSPTVLLISGTDTASDLWHAADQKGPTVYDDIQRTTRVCAYDRPGAPHLDQTLSRSDPVPQPTSPQNGVDDLVALLKAADVPGPYVLVAHSFSGTIARVFAGQHPDEVKGIVFVDVLTPELRAQMTPEEWKIWKRVNARPAKALATYPDLERQDFDETLDQTVRAAALRPMPVVVLPATSLSMSCRSSSKPVSCHRIHRRTSERSSIEQTRLPRNNSPRSCPARCTSPTLTQDTTS